jgi:hypothetical protein
MSSYFDSSIVLKLKPFKSSAAEIIRDLSDKRILEEEFLIDPAGYLAAKLHSQFASRIPRGRLNGANRFLFSVMSNEKFLGWLTEYQAQALKSFEEDPLAIIDKNKVRLDLAKAMVEFGDAEIIGAILPGNLKPTPGDDPEVAFDVIGTIAGGPVVLLMQVVTTNSTQVQTIAGPPFENASVAVEIETLIYAVAAVAVFVVAVAVIGAEARFADRAILRDVFVDVRQMNNIAESLVQMGRELRNRGRL